MARVVKGSRSLLAYLPPARLSTNGIPDFAFATEDGLHLPTLKGLKAELARAPQR